MGDTSNFLLVSQPTVNFLVILLHLSQLQKCVNSSNYHWEKSFWGVPASKGLTKYGLEKNESAVNGPEKLLLKGLVRPSSTFYNLVYKSMGHFVANNIPSKACTYISITLSWTGASLICFSWLTHMNPHNYCTSFFLPYVCLRWQYLAIQYRRFQELYQVKSRHNFFCFSNGKFSLTQMLHVGGDIKKNHGWLISRLLVCQAKAIWKFQSTTKLYIS